MLSWLVFLVFNSFKNGFEFRCNCIESVGIWYGSQFPSFFPSQTVSQSGLKFSVAKDGL